MKYQERRLKVFEKPKGDNRWVNGGFFVCEPEILNYIQGDDTSWETEPLENLAAAQELSVFKHDGFWRSMDTLRDKVHLEKLWNDGGGSLEIMVNHNFWQNRKVAVTGHTGFKGSWLTFWLNKLQSQIHGFAQTPQTNPSLFDELELKSSVCHRLADIGNFNAVNEWLNLAQPEVIFHLAAQPLVEVPREPTSDLAKQSFGDLEFAGSRKNSRATLCSRDSHNRQSLREPKANNMIIAKPTVLAAPTPTAQAKLP